MTEIYSTDQLLKILSGNIFFHFTFGDFGEKFTSFDVFNNHEDFSLVSHYFFKLNNMWMTNETHHGNFTFDLFHQPLFLELFFFDNFDSHVFVCGYVSSMIHFCEISLP
ncbi:hypothetical protein MtrunA17_Chr2g0333841 [Medicago truncatula]|uniref:Uncharacterized protein n=1 Tax=Medicago truncatula TaxID=3880 RepID=A0A396JNH4_MEDTR|nr:hypothetical protein MtrunA17_Chr2g0333841 [Medicago truncatula]